MGQDMTTVSPRQGFKVLQVIWAMMIATLGVLALAAFFIPVGGTKAVPAGPASFILGLAAGGLFVVQLKLHQNLADGKLFPRVLDLDSWGLGPDAAVRFKELKVPERGTQLILQAHIIFGIISWTLGEAVAIMGLVLTFLTGEPRFMAVFGAVALGELLWFRPNRNAFEEQLGRWGIYVEMNRNQESGIRNQEGD